MNAHAVEQDAPQQDPQLTTLANPRRLMADAEILRAPASAERDA